VKKKIIGTAGTLLGLFLIGSIMQSRESRADGVYSSPVTVMNTTANPAISLGAENLARVPYESSVSQICPAGQGSCQFNFNGPGQGHRLVIEHVSGQLFLGSSTTLPPDIQFNIANNNGNGGAVGNYWGIPAGPLVPGVSGGQLASMFNQNVSAHVDGGGGLGVVIYSNFAGSSVVTLSGYMQDCSVLACAPILH
jgi:hypothetical protein